MAIVMSNVLTIKFVRISLTDGIQVKRQSESSRWHYLQRLINDFIGDGFNHGPHCFKIESWVSWTICADAAAGKPNHRNAARYQEQSTRFQPIIPQAYGGWSCDGAIQALTALPQTTQELNIQRQPNDCCHMTCSGEMVEISRITPMTHGGRSPSTNPATPSSQPLLPLKSSTFNSILNVF